MNNTQLHLNKGSFAVAGNRIKSLALTVGIMGLSSSLAFGAKTATGAGQELTKALKVVSKIFSGPLAGVLGTLALVVGVVSYLVSTSTDMSPILRILLKIVFAMSLLTGGTTLIGSIFTGTTVIPL